jgi:FG-GAP repeat
VAAGGAWLALALALAPAASAHAAATPKTRDLRSAATFEIVGAKAYANVSQTGPAGDVNGDGRADVLISSQRAGTATRPRAGEAYVVFGRAARAGVRRAVVQAPAPTPAQGFRIVGPQADAALGPAVAAGDLDGDGLSDLLLGAAMGDDERGAAYVVFGKRDGRTVDLRHLGTQGFRIHQEGVVSLGFGRGVGAGRDVNGDGRPDLVISQYPGANPAGRDAYVIFGGTVARGADLALPRELPGRGYVLHGANDAIQLVGDMNGDGRAEVAAAAMKVGTTSEVAHVAFGKADDAPLDLAALGPAGFSVVDAPGPGGGGGWTLNGGGDVNGDGLADLVLGATFRIKAGKRPLVARNRVSVVFGAADSAGVTLGTPSPRLLTILMPPLADPILDPLHGHGFPFDGTRAGAAGDLDGDGLADITFNGAQDAPGRKGAGTVWIVRGRRTAGTVSLTTLGRGEAVRFDGAYAHDGLDGIANPVGDFDGDGRADLILTGTDASRHGRTKAGLAWIVPAVAP